MFHIETYCFRLTAVHGYLPPANEVPWPGGGGLQAHTQGRGWGVWPGGSPGPHLGRAQAHTGGEVSRPTPGGSRSRGVYPSMHWGRHPPPPQHTATAADGTHPTGMHSCLEGDRARMCEVTTVRKKRWPSNGVQWRIQLSPQQIKFSLIS